ncbi:MAG: hypothetical protein Q8T13_04255 [Acidobacteriota bacterium]|nr:hypothetical protein [Acidobacteriota bacterium]
MDRQSVERSIAWISLQPDGAISVGLTDRAFVSPRFHARQFVWNAYNRVTLEYLVPHSPHELQAVTNPHLTFHPPVYFHLRANGDSELFAGIAEVEIMLAQEGHVPWIRFVSKPVSQISRSGNPRHSNRTESVKVPVESSDVSIGVAIDFVLPGAAGAAEAVAERFVDCGQNRLHIRCELLPPQEPTLAWYHQY